MKYTPFSPEQLLDVHICIRGVESGSYTVTETSVSRRSGSSFDQWVAMGGMELREQKAVDNLHARSVPMMSRYVAAEENGELNLDSLLDMLEVKLIEIRPVKS